VGNDHRQWWLVSRQYESGQRNTWKSFLINQLAFEPKDQTRAIIGTNDGNVQYGHGLGVGAIALWVDLTGGNRAVAERPILDVAMDPTTNDRTYWICKRLADSMPTRRPLPDTFSA